jgi:hypothetical protein
MCVCGGAAAVAVSNEQGGEASLSGARQATLASCSSLQSLKGAGGRRVVVRVPAGWLVCVCILLPFGRLTVIIISAVV